MSDANTKYERAEEFTLALILFIVGLFFGPVLLVVIVLYRNNIDKNVRLIWFLSIIFAVLWLITYIIAIISIVFGAVFGR